MNKRQIEVYEYFKSLYPEALLVFHVKSEYVILFEDAEKVTNFEGLPVTDCIRYDDSKIEVLSNMSDISGTVKIVEYRNEEGEYDLPDIQILKAEQDEDY